MGNELLWLIVFLVDFGLFLLCYRFCGRVGVYVWVAIATILANIQVLKLIPLCGTTATLGNVLYATLFLATDILSENYDEKSAKIGVALGFVVQVASLVLMQCSLLFAPASEDFIHPHLKALFSVVPRVVGASFVAYLCSQYFNVWCYGLIRRLLPGKGFLWVRNNGATMVSQLLDTMLFVAVAFGGLVSWEVLRSIFFTTYFLKIVAAALDTPFLYLAKKLHEKGLVREL